MPLLAFRAIRVCLLNTFGFVGLQQYLLHIKRSEHICLSPCNRSRFTVSLNATMQRLALFIVAVTVP
jgi:hypothetical protein